MACIIKLITVVIYAYHNKLVFVHGKPLLPSLEFMEKPSSLLRKLYITAVISFMLQAPGVFIPRQCNKIFKWGELRYCIFLLKSGQMFSKKRKKSNYFLCFEVAKCFFVFFIDILSGIILKF